MAEELTAPAVEVTAPEAQQASPGADPATDMRSAPGGPLALGMGCVCSVLANAGYRTGVAEHPLIDPSCSVHAKDQPG